MEECFIELSKEEMETAVGGLGTNGWCMIGGMAIGIGLLSPFTAPFSATVLLATISGTLGMAAGFGLSGCLNFSNGC